MKKLFTIITQAFKSETMLNDFIKAFEHTSSTGREYLYIIYNDKLVKVWAYIFGDGVCINATITGSGSAYFGKHLAKVIDALELTKEVQAQLPFVKETI